MNIRWTVILGVIALAVLGWFYSLNQQDSSLQNLIKKADSPEYVGNKMETTIFSPEGKKQYFATAEKVEYYTTDGHTDFEKPIVHLFDVAMLKSTEKTDKAEDRTTAENKKADDGVQSWKISANKAKLSKDNMLYLDGNVVAQSLDPTSRLQRLETESAIINLKTQDINSNSTVKINGQNFTSTGLKLVGNLQQQIATLKEQVKTYYEVNQN